MDDCILSVTDCVGRILLFLISIVGFGSCIDLGHISESGYFVLGTQTNRLDHLKG